MWDYRGVLQVLRASPHLVRLTALLLNSLICGISSLRQSGPMGACERLEVSPSSRTSLCSNAACQTRTLTWSHSCPVGQEVFWTFYAVLATPWGVLEVTGDPQEMEVALHESGVDCQCWNV